METPSDHARWLAGLEFQAESWSELGVELIPAKNGLEAAPKKIARVAATAEAQRQESLAEIAQEIANCQNCPLGKTRKCTVPGAGASQASLLFVGEAPGAEEDQQGLPFVGRSGQLLTKIIESGMGLRRQDVFLANTLKCRPPENRNPNALETEACRPFLDRQIALLQPRLVIALGRVAAHQLLASEAPLSKLRGIVHQRADGLQILVTYHPSYLLREPKAKAACWQDIQLGLRHLGLAPPTPQQS